MGIAADIDIIVGINLLREGLDLPEVSLVAILDADKEGFLRSATSLIQTIGRCARHVDATVILYGDKVSNAMRQAIDETSRRRKMQLAYNKANNITPQTIRKAINTTLTDQLKARKVAAQAIDLSRDQLDDSEEIAELQRQMLSAAAEQNFELAARIRDQIAEIKPETSD